MDDSSDNSPPSSPKSAASSNPPGYAGPNGDSAAAFYSKYGPVNEGGRLWYSVQIGGRYGDMPDDYLTNKFESTDDQDQAEYSYEEFGRRQLVDRRPDPATFAYEEPRIDPGVRAGFLNLIHTGTRSGAEPRHPEAFLDDTWGDPRGIATDPDFKKLADQEKARLRFIRFSADADHSVTGLGVSEEQNVARLNQIKREVAPRYKIFSTSKDGKRNGMSRVFTNESSVGKTERPVQSYGDAVQDAALVPQRHTTILSNTDIRRSKAYHQFTTDHEFAVAKYGEDGRTRKLSMDIKPLEYTDTDSELSESAKADMYRALVVNIANAVKMKSQGQTDTDQGVETMTQAHRKATDYAKDLSRLMYAAQSTVNFSQQDVTLRTKSAPLTHDPSDILRCRQDHVAPTVQTLNSQIIRKGVKKCEDPLKIQDHVLYDDKLPILPDGYSFTKKSGPVGSTLRIDSIDFDTDHGIPLMTRVYRSLHRTPAFNANGAEVVPMADGDCSMTAKQPSLGAPTGASCRPRHGTKLSEMGTKSRHIAPMGTKENVRKYGDKDRGMDDGSMVE